MRTFEYNMGAILLFFYSVNSFSHGKSFLQRHHGTASKSEVNGNPFTIDISSKKIYRSSNNFNRLQSNKKPVQNAKKLDLTVEKRRETSSQKSTILSSSIVENPASDSSSLYLRLDEMITTLKEVEWQDLAVVTCYGCNTLALGKIV
jgi:hypothetical protein